MASKNRLLALIIGATFGASSIFPVLADPESLSALFGTGITGDFDGNGSLDVLTQSDSAKLPLVITFSDHTAEFAERTITIPPGYLGLDWSSGDSRVIPGDFNGDDLMDLIVQPLTPDSPGALLLAASPGEYPTVSQSIPADFLGFDWAGISAHIVAGDFNGDGRDELLLQANDPMGLFYVINSDATGQLVSHGQGWIDEYLARRWASDDTAVHSGDFNGDHHDDLLLQPLSPARPGRADDATFAFVPAEGTGRFERVAQTWGIDEFDAEWDSKTHRLIIGDFDGDGIDDFWLRAIKGGMDHLLINAPNSLAAEHVTWSDGVPPRTAWARFVRERNATATPAALSVESADQALMQALEQPGEQAQQMMAPTHGTQVVGALTGSAGVSGGAASYSVTIVTPPGRNGMQPSVGLSYSSRGGNGELGMGWSLSAGSSIHRCAAAYAQDGYTASVAYDDVRDRLCLDGQKLRIASGAYGSSGAVYRTELESFVRVEQTGSLSSNGSSFIVRYKDGRTAYFGSSSNNQLGVPAANSVFVAESKTGAALSTPLAWGLGRIEDRSGNRITFGYTSPATGEHHLSEIRYTGDASSAGDRSVVFTWETRADLASSYQGGGRTPQTQRLSSIQTKVGAAVVRQYYLNYVESQATRRSALQSIEECALQGGTTFCYPPTEFEWRIDAPVYASSRFTLPNAPSSDMTVITPWYDIDGDGRAEFLRFGNDGTATPVDQIVWLDGSRNIVKTIARPPNSSPMPLGNGPDFDLDGRGDGLALGAQEHLIDYWVADYGTPNAPFDRRPTGIPNRPGLDFSLQPIDLDSDGRVDFVQLTTSSIPSHGRVIKYWRNMGASSGDSRAVVFADLGEIYDVAETESIFHSTAYGSTSYDDLNGDGRTDLQVQEPVSGGGIRRAVLINTTPVGGGTPTFVRKTYGELGVTPNLEAVFHMFADINGDGLTDLLYAGTSQNVGGRVWAIQFNRGAGTSTASLQSMFGSVITTDRNEGLACIPTSGCNSTPYQPKFAAALRWMDIDNDGRAELLYPGSIVNAWCTLVWDESDPNEPDEKEICGLGHYTEPLSSPAFDNSIWNWNAIRFSENTARDLMTVSAFASGLVGNPQSFDKADAFGDGLTDFTTFVPNDHASGSAYYKAGNQPALRGMLITSPAVNLLSMEGNVRFPAPDFMVGAIDGLGRATHWDFVPLSANPPRRESGGPDASTAPPFYYALSYANPEQYAGPTHRNIGVAMYAVERLLTSHGAAAVDCVSGPDCANGFNTVRYSYAQGITNIQGRGFQGFRDIVTEDLSAGLRTTTTFLQKFPNAGNVLKVTVQPLTEAVGSTAYLSRSDQTWTCADSEDPANACRRTGAGTYVPFLQAADERTYDLNGGAELASTIVDNLQSTTSSVLAGCASKSVRTSADAFYSSTATTELTAISSDESSGWWLCKVDAKTVTVSQTCATQPCPSHATASNGEIASTYSYTATRQVDVETVTTTSGPVSGSVVRSNDYGHDAWGNATSVTASGSVNGIATLARTTTSSFALSSGYFANQITNAVGHASQATVSSLHGQPESTIDPNSITTAFGYDAFGRVQSVQATSAAGSLPMQSTVRSSCVDCTTVGRSRYSVTVSQPGSPTSTAWFDMHGRQLQTSTEGFDGTYSVSRQSYFDSLGRAKGSSDPFSNTAGVLPAQPLWNMVDSYDVLGRPLLSHDAKGTTTTTSYSGLQATQQIVPVGAASRTVSQWKDTRGRLVRTRDANGNDTEFRYDAFGNPVLIRDPNNNQILTTFNAAGHKLDLVDPDLGHWTYGYNAFGELVTQTDAKGQSTTFVLDALGRATQRTEGSEIATWSWDPVNGKGKVLTALLSVGGVSQHSETTTYDAFSRPQRISTAIDGGTAYEMDTTYDAFGRVESIAYPLGTVNAAPVAQATANPVGPVSPGSVVTLDGSGSYDPNSGPQPLSYNWTQTAGPTVSIPSPNAVSPSVTLAQAGTYAFSLAVSDGGASANAGASVVATGAPNVPTNVVVTAPASDGAHTVSWTAPSQPPTVVTYDLQRSTDGGTNWSSVATVNAPTTSKAMGTTVTNRYKYAVRACIGASCSVRSAASADVLVVRAPSGVSTDGSTSDGNFGVYWSGPGTGGWVETYQVYKKLISSSTWTLAATVAGSLTSTNLFIAPIIATRTYNIKLRACIGTICSPDSAIVNVIIEGTGCSNCLMAPPGGDETGVLTPANPLVPTTDPKPLFAATRGGSLRGLHLATPAEYRRALARGRMLRTGWAAQALLGAAVSPYTADPNRVVVRYEYTGTGYLKRVVNDRTDFVYWTANALDARGNVTLETFGNGRTTTRVHNDASGYLTSIVTDGGTQNLTYAWDSLGNLQSRGDQLQGISETFTYDALNRLTAWNGPTSGTTSYDAIGNIQSKSDVGAYTYGAKPHAVTSAGSKSYTYDPNGNMSARDGQSVSWSHANLPTHIQKDGSNASDFSYAASRARYKQVATNGGVSETTLYVGGLFEKITKGGITTYRYAVSANGLTVAQLTQDASANLTASYFHRDHLGGVESITNASGARVNPPQSLSYDAFGKRRDKDWNGVVASGDVAAARAITHRGFTGHEMLDNLELVHMNGRVYDPTIGRFMSVDPVFQFPENTQSLNPYSYVLNNPLSFTDPTGFATCSQDSSTKCLSSGMNTVKMKDGSTKQVYVGKAGEKVSFKDTKTGNITTGTLKEGKAVTLGNGSSNGQGLKVTGSSTNEKGPTSRDNVVAPNVAPPSTTNAPEGQPLPEPAAMLDISDKKLTYDENGEKKETAAVAGRLDGKITPGNKGALPAGHYRIGEKVPLSKDWQGGAGCDKAGNCWFIKLQEMGDVDMRGRDPGTFGIHPDGNKTGTAGCIGLCVRDTSGVRDALQKLRGQVLEVRP